VLPAFWTSAPLTVSVPIELPGATTPMLVTEPKMVPAPPSTPSAPTVTSPVMLPFTASRPLVTLVGPV
jgi:hypothetical protein